MFDVHQDADVDGADSATANNALILDINNLLLTLILYRGSQ